MQNFGCFPPEFKEWAATRSMHNLVNHKCGDHSMCPKFVHYSQCMRPPEKHLPRHPSFTDYDRAPYSGGETTGYMSSLAGLFIATWTASPYMARNIRATLHNPRSSRAEGCFSEGSKWLTKVRGYSLWGYKMGWACVVLSHNESAERRQKTSGQIRTHIRHKERGLLQAGLDRRAQVMEWRTDLMEDLQPDSERLRQLGVVHRAAIAADYTRRGLHCQKFEVEVDTLAAAEDGDENTSTCRSLQGSAGSTLNMCPVKVEKRQLAYCPVLGGLLTIPEFVRDSWATEAGMDWESPFPLPNSKRFKAAIEAAQVDMVDVGLQSPVAAYGDADDMVV